MTYDVLRLADLPPDPNAHPGDPGTEWHPRRDKTEAYAADGNLRDLDDDEIAEHFEKPEADEQYDGVRRRQREARELGAAEDSDYSEPGRV